MQSLTEAVKKKITAADRKPMFSDAVLDAMRLADEFEQVTAEDYKIPVDALAGFKSIPEPEKV